MPESPSTVANLRLTPAAAEQRIHRRSVDTSNVALTKHAKERMLERDIFSPDLYEILRTGHVEGSPIKTPEGEWKCKITRQLKGRRVAGAVVVLTNKEKIVVITVEWEDGK